MAKLKGHAVIELTDVNTGKKEVVEHDNIITNGAQNLLNTMSALYDRQSIDNGILPIEQRLMCGVLLFDEALTESANNYQLPDIKDAKLTGYAGNATSDGNDNKRGDFNSAESEYLSNGYKFVWDFGTDDANGQIASLGLTNFIMGYHGYNLDFYRALNDSQGNTGNGQNNYKGMGLAIQELWFNDSSERALFKNLVSYENGILTTVDKVSSSSISIKKYLYAIQDVKIKSVIDKPVLIDEQIIAYTDTNQAITDTYFVDGKDGYYYGLFAYESASTYSLSVSKIDKTTLAYTPATVYSINLSAQNIYMPGIYSTTSSTQTRRTNVVVRNGAFYAYYYATSAYYGSGTLGIIKFPISDPTNYTKIAGTEKAMTLYDYENITYFVEINGNLFTSICMLGSDDTVVDLAADFNPSGGSSYYGFGRSACDGKSVILSRHTNNTIYFYIYPLLASIESINNLDSPVLKTASKTMKITYTLTEAT